MFKPAGSGGKPNSAVIHRMIKHNVLTALSGGYNVILEGILSQKAYATLFEEIFAEHPEENYIFYLDISFEETVRRHKTRTIGDPLFGAKEMKEWFSMAHRSNHRFERIISEDS